MSRRRIHNEYSYLLHRRPYSETSLLVDLFTREHGRIAAIAKGARRLKSRFRGALQPFQELVVQYSGKGEVRTMTLAEPVVAREFLSRERLLCGYYMSELVIRMLHRFDPHEVLYDAYKEAIQLIRGNQETQQVLRQFEKTLLEEVGYGLHLEQEPATGRDIERGVLYRYRPGTGPTRYDGKQGEGVLVHGDSLLALSLGATLDARSRLELKRLTRGVLTEHMNGRVIHSRAIYGKLFPGLDVDDELAEKDQQYETRN